jgi:ribosome-associated heat shock protein Hsp15
MAENIRVDKWLWAVRIFKTRSQATEACRKGRVSIDDLPVKPSRILHPGEIVKVRKEQAVRSFKVLKPAEKRMSAKFVPDFLEDVTPPGELEIIEMQKNMRWITREKGKGRPTKRERRDLDEFFDA